MNSGSLLSWVFLKNTEIMTNKGPGIFMKFVRLQIENCFIQENDKYSIFLDEIACQNLLQIANESNYVGVGRKKYITGEVGGPWGYLPLSKVSRNDPFLNWNE